MNAAGPGEGKVCEQGEALALAQERVGHAPFGPLEIDAAERDQIVHDARFEKERSKLGDARPGSNDPQGRANYCSDGAGWILR